MKASSLAEVQSSFEEIHKKVLERYDFLNIASYELELKDLQKKLEDPDLWQADGHVEKMRNMQMKIASLDKKVNSWRKLKLESEDIQEYIEIAVMENEVSLLDDLNERITQFEKLYDKLDLESLLQGEDDFRNAFLNIHPGAGGTESHDWADMLYRLYVRWAEKHNYDVQIMDYLEGDEAGIKNVTLLIKGINAYGFLKAENGVHRLVRISPFDSNKKRHTSFASVHVSPEISDDVDIEIEDKDIRVDTFRASGAGGQHINKTDSAIRITHQPSGIVVSCQNERSQIKNRATAMKMLKARLYEVAKAEKDKEIESKSGERKDISWGNQIRSYVFHPYNLVKDLRTNHENSNVQAVMDGDLDSFIDAFLRSTSKV